MREEGEGVYLPCEFVGGGEEKEKKRSASCSCSLRNFSAAGSPVAPANPNPCFPALYDLAWSSAWRKVNCNTTCA